MIIEIDPLTDPRWDQFVIRHPFGLICHLSGWKQVLEESFPHMKSHYLAMLNHNDHSIQAALPVFEVRSILTGNRLVSIPFATNCDPLISSNEEMRELLDSVIELSSKLGISRLELRTLASWQLIHDDRIGIMVHHKSHQLCLESGFEELIKTFSKQVRRKIKTFLNTDFDLSIAGSETDLFEFYYLYVKTRKRLGLPPQPYVFFKLLWEKFSPANCITLFLVKYRGQLIVGLMMFKFKDRCSWDYLASDVSFQNLHTSYFILWEAIKFAHSEGYKIFDFGRTGVRNTGLMNFKSLWGTKVIDLPQFYYSKQSSLRSNVQEASLSYMLIRNISRHIPDSLFKSLGNFIYRHLG